MKKIVVLASGHGSNLQAIIDACQQGQINGQIAAVFSDNVDAYALTRARNANIPAYAIAPSEFHDRIEFDHHLLAEIDTFAPNLVVLAGFMRILSPQFVAHYQYRLLNIHPSLLPKYPGLHTHHKALENGDKEHGTSVHFVTDQLDSGPVVLQAKVPILPGDTEEKVKMRVQQQEYIIYPLVISWFLDGHLTACDHCVWLDGKKLSAKDLIYLMEPPTR